MEIVAQHNSNSQVTLAQPQNLLFCSRNADLARDLARAKGNADWADTTRRRASSARLIVHLLRKLHGHRASCSACLVREALGGVQ
jgi:hypothetical protein